MEENIETIITTDWLGKYIEKTRKYDYRDWYLALSSRKNVHDYLVSFYQNPKGYLSLQGHRNFNTPEIAERLNQPTPTAWKTFLEYVEGQLNSTLIFIGEYPTQDSQPVPDKPLTPDKCTTEQLSDSPFIIQTIVENDDNESVMVRIFTHERYYREYTCQFDGICFLKNALSYEMFYEWYTQNADAPKALIQIISLAQKIKNGEILSFSEDERKNIAPLKETELSLYVKNMEESQLSVRTITTGYAFLCIDSWIACFINDEMKKNRQPTLFMKNCRLKKCSGLKKMTKRPYLLKLT